ncbi:hypothetical protein NAT51_19590 [Flavobacterium amniphilum]|uniref:hypothetical protein n=1 Tax=Flavobacterium amniphilum TaxID=1834035 RepID=UPI002029D274|nr:hypothetical protein [Flavobacterium amniphilum]MCL9807729.1 hypothetical protein [Flavobacterium amniphilum]
MRFVDPDGMQADDLIFRSIGGTSKEANSESAFSKVESVINNGLGGDFAKIGNDGKLTLNVNRDDLKTEEQKGFYDILDTAMQAEKDVKVDVLESDNFVMGGMMDKNHPDSPGIIDIDDIMNVGSSGELDNSTVSFSHEIYETYEKQVHNNTAYKNAEGTGAHQIADREMSRTNGGWIGGNAVTTNGTQREVSYRLPGGGRKTGTVKSGTITKEFKKGSRTRYFTYRVVDGNIVKR